MKKGSQILICITLCFMSMILGVFLGRNTIGAALTAEPRSSYEPQATDPSTADVFQDGKININTASVEDLILLPGIGEVIAERIIAYRNLYGNFTSIDELRNVEGIGESRMTNIAKYVTIGD